MFIDSIAALVSDHARPPQPTAVAQIDRSILDAVGTTILGARRCPVVDQTVTLFADTDGPGRVLFSRRGFSIEDAAYLNGVAAQALLYGDFSAGFDPTATILPTLLALAQASDEPIAGAALITSYLAGFDLALALAQHGVRAPDGAFVGTAVFGTIGATAAGAHLLGMDAASTATALGIAASCVGGVRVNETTSGQASHAGRSARNAVRCVLLARRGFTAVRSVLEQPQGFFDAYLGPDPVRAEQLVSALATSIESRAIALRRFPGCAAAVRVAETVAAVMHSDAIEPGRVIEVLVTGVPASSEGLRCAEPADSNSARFSIRHAAAVALTTPGPAFEPFETATVVSPEFVAARRKVEVEVLARWDPRQLTCTAAGEIVVVITDDGRRHSRPIPPIWPDPHAAGADLPSWCSTAKFTHNLSAAGLDPAEAERIASGWSSLSTHADVSESFSALATHLEGALA